MKGLGTYTVVSQNLPGIAYRDTIRGKLEIKPSVMESQPITLHLPDITYRRLSELANQSKRSVAEETVNLLHSVLTTEEELASDVNAQLEQLPLLTDDQLWTVATATASDADNELMQQLLEKRQREGISADELTQLQTMSAHFNRIMLTRAKSAALLLERGHDISAIASPQ